MAELPQVQKGPTFMKHEEYASFVNSPHLCRRCSCQRSGRSMASVPIIGGPIIESRM